MSAPSRRDALLMPSARGQRVLVWAGLLLLALSLRPLVTSVGPVLSDVRTNLHMSGAVASLTTTLPVLCFAAFAGLTPVAVHSVGLHRTSLLAMTALTGGLLLRVAVASQVVFVLGSVLALAGAGAGNVLAPALVKRHFPDRVSLITGIYSMLLQATTALGAAVSVPLADSLGGWRAGLGSWALLSALAMLPWLGLLGRDPHVRTASGRIAARDLVGSRTAWMLALFFGAQSAQAYAVFGWLPDILHSAGVGKQIGGIAVSIVAAAGVPVSIALPFALRRLPGLRPLMIFLAACYVAAYAGLLLAPSGAPYLWALLLGLGGGAFPLCLTLLGLRARTTASTNALSGFVQSVGYVVAAPGPFLVGALHDATGSWTPPLAVLLVSIAGMLALGFGVARPTYVDDEL
ncbi:MAG: MFS transporter [Pseudonocardiales bacterium]|nr:MAG: MFS transporter [Pseudonocardiales bacterium]